ncbi:LOW QUALITY PROTEIN: DDB1- and CUL4-associated factor 10-like [Sminthopsis crassicaudata]|uniref:LOW QUALITY PROTEIN: DDB1- and CUL4-associated factor 10-like n=1 Tax=Sminthopsis crassicaudata TaxID=9301 RepID=UPI003D694787
MGNNPDRTASEGTTGLSRRKVETAGCWDSRGVIGKPSNPAEVEEELAEEDLISRREVRSPEGSGEAKAGSASSPSSLQPSDLSSSPYCDPREPPRDSQDSRRPFLTEASSPVMAEASGVTSTSGELVTQARGESSSGSPQDPSVPSPQDSPTARSMATAMAACPPAFSFSRSVPAAASSSRPPKPRRMEMTRRPLGAPLFRLLESRSLGRGNYIDPARDNFRMVTSLYKTIHPEDSLYLNTRTHGAIFNLEYSPNGSVLTAACELNEVLLFDPISSKHIRTLSEAHNDCVNNIKFLDDRLFATCSDDSTVALWDLRKLNSKVCTLQGHTSWVKNIEYDVNTRLLVTSGFDGNVIIWDTNLCTEDGCPHKTFFHTRFLMRMRLAPDSSKMLISTSTGYLLIVHDLDLAKSLEVGRYPIIRAGRTALRSNAATSASSRAPRAAASSSRDGDSGSLSEQNVSPPNCLEILIPEVPVRRHRGNCITSLQVHPQGQAALLRCSTNTDDQEWTCVYEFLENPPIRPFSPHYSLRLAHYIEETNVSSGYIKEVCFSPDGRLISSPHGYGIRLFGLDTQCNELFDCLLHKLSPLSEIHSFYSHNDVVLTTKFSPTHCQIASGCLSGLVSFYQPKF